MDWNEAMKLIHAQHRSLYITTAMIGDNQAWYCGDYDADESRHDKCGAADRGGVFGWGPEVVAEAIKKLYGKVVDPV